MVKSDIEKIEARMLLGDSLERLRKKRGLSAYALAQKSDLRDAQVRTIEIGKNGYTIDSLAAYLRGLGLNLTEWIDSLLEPVEAPKRGPGNPNGRKFLPRIEWEERDRDGDHHYFYRDKVLGTWFDYKVFTYPMRFEIWNRQPHCMENVEIVATSEEDLLIQSERLINQKFRAQRWSDQYRIDPNF